MLKLPIPFRKQGQQIAYDGCEIAQADYYTEEQMKSYAAAVLRQAAKECELAAQCFDANGAAFQAQKNILQMIKSYF